MKFLETTIPGSYLIELEPVHDERGWFARYYCKKEFSEIGHNKEWVQMNQSVNLHKGTLRGLHYQSPPNTEIKLVRCVNGSIFDVIVDIRQNSPTFLQHFEIELSAEKQNMIYVPAGFAHGFQCLSDNCVVLYHHSSFYEPSTEGGLRFNDPLLKINWPMAVSYISRRDSDHPLLDENFKGI